MSTNNPIGVSEYNATQGTQQDRGQQTAPGNSPL